MRFFVSLFDDDNMIVITIATIPIMLLMWLDT